MNRPITAKLSTQLSAAKQSTRLSDDLQTAFDGPAEESLADKNSESHKFSSNWQTKSRLSEVDLEGHSATVR